MLRVIQFWPPLIFGGPNFGVQHFLGIIYSGGSKIGRVHFFCVFAGVWLRGQVFTHGQLYVACSRVSSPGNLKFALMQDQKGTAVNIVFKEVLLGH